MSIRPSVGNVSPRPTNPTTNDGNSSAAQPAAPDEQPQIIRGNRHALLSTAPECVKDWAAGKMPTTAAAFNTCVGWLVRNGQHEGLRDLLTSPKCSGFDTLDLSGKPLTSDALGVLALHLDRSCVTKLNLSGCQLEGKEHADAIGVLLGNDSKLELINLSHNKIGNMAPICNALSKNGPLQHLNLRNCGLTGCNYGELLHVLCEVREEPVSLGSIEPSIREAKNRTLQTLCLADNDLAAMDLESFEIEAKKIWAGESTGRMPSMKWLDLSNTGITIRSTLMLSLGALRCPRLDLSRNQLTDTTLLFLSGLRGVTHLDLQGVSGTGLSVLTLLDIRGLRVLDLRGADRDLLRPSSLVHVGEAFVCLRLDREVAEDPGVKAIPGLTPLSSGDLVGPGGGFLASWSPPGLSPQVGLMPGADVSESTFAKKLDEELDVRSIASLMTVNKALNASKGEGLTQALLKNTDDPGFDWDEATWIAKDTEAEDVSETSALTTTTSLTATTATTTTTTDLSMTTAITGTGAPGS